MKPAEMSNNRLNQELHKLHVRLGFVPLNYCAKWDHLMPLVVEHRISLKWNDSLAAWDAVQRTHGSETKLVTSTREPQRVLAECLLLVLQDIKL